MVDPLANGPGQADPGGPALRILLVAWEFPPVVVGGLGAHTDGLSRALARAGHDVVVLTRQAPGLPDAEVIEGVRVLRAWTDMPRMPDDPLVRVASANHHLSSLADGLEPGWRPDVVHTHDWLGAWTGDALRHRYGVPLVATVHATELGRHGGVLHSPLSDGIHATEWWLTYQATDVICCSWFMVDQVSAAFDLPPWKVFSIPNGVEADRWRPEGPRGGGDGDHAGPLVVTWGRLEYEKGFQTVVAAAGRLHWRFPGLRLAVIGQGTYADDLARQAWDSGVGHVVAFPGFVTHDELVAALGRCQVAVIPSFYEPFGIVALEAMAAGAPVVAADSGGLHEVLADTGAGVLYAAGDADACAAAIDRMLTDPWFADNCRSAGEELLRTTYSWDAIAARTVEVYRHARGEGPGPAGASAADR